MKNKTSNIEMETESTRLYLKPKFNEKPSWNIYHRQFEVAASLYYDGKGVTLTLVPLGEDILQTLSSQEQKGYNLLAKHFELRYRQIHLEQVYRCQLKNRY